MIRIRFATVTQLYLEKKEKEEMAEKKESKQVNPVLTLLPLTTAAVATAITMYPVDVLRALKMSSAGDKNALSIGQYYKKFGVRGFVSQGVIPEVAKSSLMRVSKFFFFPIICTNLYGVEAKEASVLQKASAGALATVPEILMISPLEVAKLGLQLDADNKYKNNSMAFIKDTYKKRGFSGLYVGWAGMQWRQSFWTGTFFATLQWWRSKVDPVLIQNFGAPVQLSQIISGFLAGFFATFPNAPGDVVRSVVQKKAFADPSRPSYGVSPQGVIEHVQVATEIVKSAGFRGLYTGLAFKAVHLGGSGALMAVFIPAFAKMFGIPYGGV